MTQLLSPDLAADELPPEVAAALAEHTLVIVRELRTALTYAIHRYGGEAAQVLLHGPGANLRGLGERLSAELGPPPPPRPADLVGCAPGVASGDTASPWRWGWPATTSGGPHERREPHP